MKLLVKILIVMMMVVGGTGTDSKAYDGRYQVNKRSLCR